MKTYFLLAAGLITLGACAPPPPPPIAVLEQAAVNAVWVEACQAQGKFTNIQNVALYLSNSQSTLNRVSPEQRSALLTKQRQLISSSDATTVNTACRSIELAAAQIALKEAQEQQQRVISAQESAAWAQQQAAQNAARAATIPKTSICQYWSWSGQTTCM